jgi:hypothetical protein
MPVAPYGTEKYRAWNPGSDARVPRAAYRRSALSHVGNFGRNQARRLQANERDERTAQALVDVFKAKHPEEAAFADEVVRKLGLA